jgi:hypothetical protein
VVNAAIATALFSPIEPYQFCPKTVMHDEHGFVACVCYETRQGYRRVGIIHRYRPPANEMEQMAAAFGMEDCDGS